MQDSQKRTGAAEKDDMGIANATGLPEHPVRKIIKEALAWGGALLLFLMAYAPVLWRPRLGEGAA